MHLNHMMTQRILSPPYWYHSLSPSNSPTIGNNFPSATWECMVSFQPISAQSHRKFVITVENWSIKIKFAVNKNCLKGTYDIHTIRTQITFTINIRLKNKRMYFWIWTLSIFNYNKWKAGRECERASNSRNVDSFGHRWCKSSLHWYKTRYKAHGASAGIEV